MITKNLIKIITACIVFLFPSFCLGYGYQTTSCTCGSELLNQIVVADLTLTNTGGMNIFYYSTDVDSQVENLYANCTKHVKLRGTTDGSGNFTVYTSTNYNNSFTLVCNFCAVDSATNDYIKMVSLFIGGLAGLGFAVATGLRW